MPLASQTDTLYLLWKIVSHFKTVMTMRDFFLQLFITLFAAHVGRKINNADISRKHRVFYLGMPCDWLDKLFLRSVNSFQWEIVGQSGNKG